MYSYVNQSCDIRRKSSVDVFGNDVFGNDVFGNDVFGNDVFGNECVMESFGFHPHLILCVCVGGGD